MVRRKEGNIVEGSPKSKYNLPSNFWLTLELFMGGWCSEMLNGKQQREAWINRTWISAPIYYCRKRYTIWILPNYTLLVNTVWILFPNKNNKTKFSSRQLSSKLNSKKENKNKAKCHHLEKDNIIQSHHTIHYI